MGIYIRWFEELGVEDSAEVGGKNASLGEIYRRLTKEGVLIPNGFAVTAGAYRRFVEANRLDDALRELLKDLDYGNVKQLREKGRACRELIERGEIPADVRKEILDGYARLVREYGDDLSLAVRSSATAEDSEEHSFAGQGDTYLNVRGEAALLDAYRRCLASNFTDRSLHYKHDQGIGWEEVSLAVTIMKMVRSDLGASGVMFSLDTETGFEDVVFINASWGLGENVVQGSVDPDSFYVHKPTYEQGYRTVLKRQLGRKEKKMIFADVPNRANISMEYTRNIDTPEEERCRFCLEDDEIMVLADYAIKVEKHYSGKSGHHMPMDMEWAKDGIDGRLYMVQARPETVKSRKSGSFLTSYRLKGGGKVLLRGHAVGEKIGRGKVHLVRNAGELEKFRPGEVLVTHTTTPDWEPVMKIASAVVTETGGRTCHAAIVSRELGIPAIVGAQGAMEILKNGSEVTVSCAEGETGRVYEGSLDFEAEEIDLSSVPSPKTGIMMNLGNPDLAFSLAGLPVKGIGLARMEFIINEYIRAHPMALLHPEKVDGDTRKRLEELVSPYKTPSEFFVKTLSEGVATIASSVYPKPCVVRMSDFKTNEYASLTGGAFFEPEEENPMIGFRGASRYSHPMYEEGFAMECAAMKRVREEMGFLNVVLMVPFCRRVGEGRKVLETMEKYGLRRGENGLKIYMMCEIPNNVIEIDAFSEIFDGFSIGSNDLTQLTLGVDRDSGIVAFDYDEKDPGVMKMISFAVKGARRNSRHIGICGQAPSDYPEMAEFLVRIGIDSISLNPDSIVGMMRRITRLEKKMRMDETG